MNLNKSTIKYITQNGWKFLPITLIAGLALAFSGNLSGSISFFTDIELNASSVWNIYGHFSMLTSRSWVVGILSLILVLFAMSVEYGILDRHLRVGKFSLRKPLASLNDTVMTTVPVIAIAMVLLEVVTFLTSAVILLLAKTVAFMSLPLAIIVTVAIYIGMMFLLAEFMLVIPAMQVVGYPFKDAFIFSTKLVSGNIKRITFDFICVIAIAITASALTAILFHGKVISLLIDTILYSFILLYIPIYSMMAFYEFTGEQRRDIIVNKKSYLT